MDRVEIRLKGKLVLIAWFVLLFFQIFSAARPIMFLLVALTVMLVLSYLWVRLQAPRIHLLRQRRHGWAQVGDIIEERFVMENDSLLPILWAEVRDKSNLPGYDAGRAIGVGAMSTSEWTTSGVCERRGIYALGPVQLRLGDPFGIFEAVLGHQRTDSFIVYPPVVKLPQLLDPRGFVRGTGQTSARSLELTTNVSSVREYVPSDALNRIHWRSTARRSALSGNEMDIYVKEFDLEPSGDLWIALDMQRGVHVGEGVDSSEEYAVILAASLASQMLNGNHAVGLVCAAKEMVVMHPRKGRDQLWRILQALAGIYADGQTPLANVLNSLEPLTGRGMSVAVITPSADPLWISAASALVHQGLYPTALLLEPEAFGGEPVMSRVMRSLTDFGIRGHVLGQDFQIQHLAKQQRKRPDYSVILGRAILRDTGAKPRPAWETVSGGEKAQRS